MKRKSTGTGRTTAFSGEADGVAAAMSYDLTAIDVGALQSELKKRGVKLHLDEIHT